MLSVTALFNNMRTLKFKAQLTTAFFATVNQMFSGHPRNTEKVSVTGAGRYGSRKRPLEVWGINGRLRELAQLTINTVLYWKYKKWIAINRTLKYGTVITVKSLLPTAM